MRKITEWVGSTDDAKIPPRVKLRVFDSYGGFCAKCSSWLKAGKWECDHIIALINGGRHIESNLQPLCLGCHADKTAADSHEKSIIARKRKKHLGIKKNRTMTRWRRFDGTIVTASKNR